jgi:hypothetical protein
MPKRGRNAFEVATVQDIEPGERNPPLLHLRHGRFVFAAPGIGEGGPVEGVAEGREDAPALVGDAVSPVDEGAEHVEEERLAVERHAIGSGKKAPSASAPVLTDAPPSASVLADLEGEARACAHILS